MMRINLPYKKRLQLNKSTIAKLGLGTNEMMVIVSGKRVIFDSSRGAEEPRCTSRPTTNQEDPNVELLIPFMV